ncbi:MAG: pilus assembly PilX N-terminal domain-containing protein [Vicinamibacterales bacterium]
MGSERGAALITSLLAIVILSAVGAALVLAATTDLAIAANAGASTEVFYAAEGAFERTLSELRDAPDLSVVLDGTVPSRFTDGASTGTRRLTDGSTIDSFSRAQPSWLFESGGVHDGRARCGSTDTSVGGEESALASVQLWTARRCICGWRTRRAALYGVDGCRRSCRQ